MTELAPYHFTIDASIPEWLAQKERRTHSAKTVTSYQDTLADFRAALSCAHLDLLDNPVDITRIAGVWANTRLPTSRRKDQPVASSTYNQRLAVISSWYSFAQETYQLAIVNPMKQVPKRPVQAYAKAEKLAPERIEQGMDKNPRQSLQDMRDYALLAVGLATGRRASEIVGLRGEDIKFTGSEQTPSITLTFHCKGGKIKRDGLEPEISAVLLDYLQEHYGKQLQDLKTDSPIWLSYSKYNRGKPIGTKTLSMVCQTYLGTSKIHALRHTFAVGMIRSGAPLTELAWFMGHTDIRVTQIYAQEIMGEENPYAEKLTARFGIKRKRP